MKHNRIIAAVLFAGILFSSCEKKMEQTNDTPSAVRQFTLSVEAVKAPGSKALALSDNGESLIATWDGRDAVAVCTTDGNALSVIGMLTPDQAGSAATTLTGTIDAGGLSEGDWLFLQFPYKVVSGTDGTTRVTTYQNQNGVLEDLARDFDYATCGVQITAINGDEVATTKASFVNRQSIVKFSLKSSGADLSADKLAVSGPVADHFGHDEYYFGPALMVQSPSLRSDFTVAMHHKASTTGRYRLFAANDDYVYAAISPATSFEDGKYYHGTVNMAPMNYDAYLEASTWSMIGVLSEYDIAWDNDLNMWTDGLGNHVAASVRLKANEEFKFRNNQDWSENAGAENELTRSAADIFPAAANGGNIKVDADGVYDIYYMISAGIVVITPASEGGKVSKPINEPQPPTPEPQVWSIIGGFNDWVGDVDMELVDGKWVSPPTTLVGDFKIRFAHSWDGGDRGAVDSNYEQWNYIPTLGQPFSVVAGGNNICISEEGDYVVTYDPENETMTVDRAADTYTVAGAPVSVFGSSWSAADRSNDMTLQDDGTYVKTYTVEEDVDVSFKIVKNHSWDISWPDNNYSVAVGAGTLTIYFNPANGDITVVANEPTGLERTYTVVGSPASLFGTEWDPENTANDMVKQADGTYKKTYSDVPEGQPVEFKIVAGHGWAVDYGASNCSFGSNGGNCYYVMNSTGTLVITFDPANGGWIDAYEE